MDNNNTGHRVTTRLAELGIDLPSPVAPAANYVPTRRTGNLLHVSGQVPHVDGKDAFTGRLGDTYDVEQGQAAARLCAINIIAQVKAALDGDLDRVTGVVRLGGFVNATPDFTRHPQVLNGASDLMVAVFGDAGRHARAAVGVSSLPRGVPVEVDAIFEVS
ncbi:enamine deaminase RidA (YjgF/YER057c/UK114 family) [Pseudochelatococcus lubricantis]|uniref:Enamine deaminase RidA (YjgF/YER057c/UK114 family) n=1 Tax=Pseudochelatococcus lubricantis TaxID=1538102 RepID=A0ABX0V1M8_9HYPH|nr:RidA family protein [Pseudochelatococcus lubricantis]NIJ59104.1 enamine deaminase RidA (YjgF/YER057c/UK114 family) [Pseudochelatococcus lubricantis]